MHLRLLPTADALGAAAAARAADAINAAMAARGRARIIAATGASQFAFLAALVARRDIDWSRVEMFHLDEYIGLPPIQVYEVASFYSMFETKPCGRVHVSICTNISCMLCGADEIVAAVEKHLGIRTGESTPDGRIYLKREEECLAACNNAPMMMVDHVYHENLTPETAIRILDGVK